MTERSPTIAGRGGPDAAWPALSTRPAPPAERSPTVAVRGSTEAAWRALATRPGAIAYLGASVTQQRDGFRPRLHARLEESLAAPRMVNAGIGGVGSMAGLFYMDDFVLPRRPELCLVEFLTADIGGFTPTNMVADAV